ncbi:MAG TPA: peptidase E [Gaiellaceae bacterium]|jgi:peptidase E|nr:peptidase E [Gaiellaceae bacterium]
MAGTIVAMGGLSWDDAERRRLEDYFLGFAQRERPRVLFVPTAAADAAEPTLNIVSQLGDRAQVSHLPFFPWPPPDVRELVLDHDVIFVSGGNTANALAIWRVHGFDEILREAWEAGVVLTGWSAGMICWFDAGVTDSFGPQLEGMRDGLGFLPGSACPHYDGEAERRPVYTRLVREGFPPGLAADDCVALRFDGTELAEVVSAREGAGAYRVSPQGEEPIEARPLFSGP